MEKTLTMKYSEKLSKELSKLDARERAALLRDTSANMKLEDLERELRLVKKRLAKRNFEKEFCIIGMIVLTLLFIFFK